MTTMLKRSLVLLAVLIGATGCLGRSGQVAKAPRDPVTAVAFNARAYEQIHGEGGDVFWIDNQDSQVRLFLWRGGRMAAKGHNHVMVIDTMEGAVFLPEDLLSDSVRLDIVFQAADIEVDPPELRRRIGGAWAKTIPPDGIRGTRDNMLGPKVLEADRFPAIGLRAEKVYGELPKLVIDAAVTLHGVTRQHLIPVTVTRDEGRLSATGAFVIRQTAFGIEPISALGGALYAHDPVLIEFDLQARKR